MPSESAASSAHFVAVAKTTALQIYPTKEWLFAAGCFPGQRWHQDGGAIVCAGDQSGVGIFAERDLS